MRKRLFALALGLSVWSFGCVMHIHRHGPPVARVDVLEAEHGDKTIVIVHERPGPKRHCWRHRHHWHCRVR